MNRKHTYTIDQLRIAIANSFSKRAVLQKLGIIPAGGNYATLDKQIKLYQLDISHFTGKVWNRGKSTGHKYPLEEYLSGRREILSHRLKLRLLKECLLEAICSVCKNISWLDRPIPLELHHIDGDHNNNNLENLCLICPNCHAFTTNYRAHKIKKSSK